jgi:L1 cell adhesion molecule like protein
MSDTDLLLMIENAFGDHNCSDYLSIADKAEDNNGDHCEILTSWKGFKLVGDNIDKNFRRTFQRVDYQTQSCHYFHLYALLDRVDLSHHSDLPGSGEISVRELIPSKEDELELKRIFVILVSR